MFNRRHFLKTAGAVAAGAFVSARAQAPAIVSSAPVLGQGEFRYRVVPGWGVLDAATPVNDCHGLARDRAGHIILLTNHPANNVIIYDRAGRLVVHTDGRDPEIDGQSLLLPRRERHIECGLPTLKRVLHRIQRCRSAPHRLGDSPGGAIVFRTVDLASGRNPHLGLTQFRARYVQILKRNHGITVRINAI